ncbi:hypothetical protein RYX36_007985 [Vicia faba]
MPHLHHRTQTNQNPSHHGTNRGRPTPFASSAAKPCLFRRRSAYILHKICNRHNTTAANNQSITQQPPESTIQHTPSSTSLCFRYSSHVWIHGYWSWCLD